MFKKDYNNYCKIKNIKKKRFKVITKMYTVQYILKILLTGAFLSVGENAALWSPSAPNLYDLLIELKVRLTSKERMLSSVLHPLLTPTIF